MSQQQVYIRRHPLGYGLEKSLEAVRNPGSPAAITPPSTDPAVLAQDVDNYALKSFTADDALELGHLLYARLLPIATTHKTPVLVSISLANSGLVVFQTAVGTGVLPDQEDWVRRKRNAVLRWGQSTWLLRSKQGGDQAKVTEYLAKHTDTPGEYAFHGGAVPIRVYGVEGVVAVVIVSGLKQAEDHAVIAETIKENWTAET